MIVVMLSRLYSASVAVNNVTCIIMCLVARWLALGFVEVYRSDSLMAMQAFHIGEEIHMYT